MKPEHKFFERYLNNDLTDLYLFLLEKNQDMLDGKFPGISKEKAEEANKTGCMATALNQYYNIFQIHHPAIYSLYSAIKSMTQEASEYYGVDFESQQYMVQGWFNCDEKSEKNLNDLHDHSPNTGTPYYHGYYCVNAEPSITNYQINRELMFDNINKNNRAILSETGHPHRKGSWHLDEKRITIAYDMMPLKDLNKNELQQHWVPLI
jgi:hypothetical protein